MQSAETKSQGGSAVEPRPRGDLPQCSLSRPILIGLGANAVSRYGAPNQTIGWALTELERAGLIVLARSAMYATAPVGNSALQYANAVAAVSTHRAPDALLRVLKQIEAQAGRRASGRYWGQRTLDLDILDYRGRVIGWRGRHPQFARAGARPLILPHPLMHVRPFVLRPLLDIAPGWRHPVLRKTASELWRGIARQQSGRVLE